MLKRYNHMMLSLLGLADLVAAAAAWWVAHSLRVLGSAYGWSRYDPPPLGQFAPSVLLSLVLALVFYSRFNLYQVHRTRSLLKELGDVMKAVFTAWGLTYVATNFLLIGRLPTISRMMMAALLGSWLVLAMAERLAAREVLRALRRRGWNLRHAAIVGTGRLAQKLYQTLRQNTWTGIEPIYFVDDGERTRLLDLEVRGPIDAIDRVLAARPADIVFVALPNSEHDRLEEVLTSLSAVNVDVQVVPDLLSFHFLRHDVSQLEDLPIIGLTSTPQQGWNAFSKRLFDVVFSALALVLLAAPMLIIAAIIRLTSKGPALYRQQRASLGGQPFEIYKFRTMRPDAEAKTGAVWATRDDARVTAIGRLLRRTSLDELPQLLNVLTGQMSLVGPRPERPELIERFRKQVPRYMLRSRVKAGLTGWAQVHGLRGNTSLRKRVQYDLYYITHWSFGLDLWIILLTPFRGLVHPNAY